jgi:hypothetical protein
LRLPHALLELAPLLGGVDDTGDVAAYRDHAEFAVLRSVGYAGALEPAPRAVAVTHAEDLVVLRLVRRLEPAQEEIDEAFRLVCM